jgi:hypothetical protein
MKRLVLLTLAATLLLASSACHIFSKKKNPVAPKQSPTFATEVEKDFMHRWIDKRANELVIQGKSSADARTQAAAEFKLKFSYTDAAQQAK